jgi:hypothetical protein
MMCSAPLRTPKNNQTSRALALSRIVLTMLSIGVMPIPPATRTIGRGESSIRKK